MTDTEAHTSTGTTPNAAPLVRRGRHRKPRPRKVMLAAGGLALAAGALSLVRMAPDSGVGASGTAEADPRLDPGGTTERSANAVTVGTVPTGPPSATAPMGEVSATPTTSAATSPTALPGGTAVPVSVPTTIPTTLPQTTNPPAPAGPEPSATTAPAPDPTHTPAPTPGRSTADPAPAPRQPGGVCVPIIGLCVDRGLGQGPSD